MHKKRADSEKDRSLKGSSSGFKAAGPASGEKSVESPPAFIKGISSLTKYSAGSNYKNFMQEGVGQIYELQEVKEQTIQEENDQ